MRKVITAYEDLIFRNLRSAVPAPSAVSPSRDFGCDRTMISNRRIAGPAALETRWRRSDRGSEWLVGSKFASDRRKPGRRRLGRDADDADDLCGNPRDFLTW